MEPMGRAFGSFLRVSGLGVGVEGLDTGLYEDFQSFFVTCIGSNRSPLLLSPIPIGSIVVPFWDYLIEFYVR